MKTALIIASLLMAAFVIYLFILGAMSRNGKAPGLIDGNLARCPDKPNCVCSEYDKDTRHYIPPIAIPEHGAGHLLSDIKNTIIDMGGIIQVETDQYLAASFSSDLFGFVDDFEVRIDSSRHVIHVRSASRVGTSDLGVNRKRAKAFSTRITRMMTSMEQSSIALSDRT